jgi:hypothetical protein
MFAVAVARVRSESLAAYGAKVQESLARPSSFRRGADDLQEVLTWRPKMAEPRVMKEMMGAVAKGYVSERDVRAVIQAAVLPATEPSIAWLKATKGQHPRLDVLLREETTFAFRTVVAEAHRLGVGEVTQHMAEHALMEGGIQAGELAIEIISHLKAVQTDWVKALGHVSSGALKVVSGVSMALTAAQFVKDVVLQDRCRHVESQVRHLHEGLQAVSQ